ncbi:MAG TPA: hypothetical protein DCF62_12920 [Porticoccaceae bacterium]|nr:hypothetical protein [Porticoccaceae bacterium]HCO61839.1 hypothetical protein [Porticoccaceae bacterium]
MRLLSDLFKKLFVRLFILLLMAIILIALEARERNLDNIEKEKYQIEGEISGIAEQVRQKEVDLATQTRLQKRLRREIASQKNTATRSLNALEKSRNAKRLRDKLPPWKAIEHLHTVVEGNIKAAEMSVKYADRALMIIDINRGIAAHTVERTRLYNRLALVEADTSMDYLLRQDRLLALLSSGDKLLLLALFYVFFFGPLTFKSLNYFVLAPLARKSPPIVINAEADDHERISYGSPESECEVPLAKGESLIVRPGWYSLNSEGRTRTRIFWDTSAPFASYAMGLFNMTEFKRDVDETRIIRIGCEEDPTQNIFPVHLDDHPGYVVRQGHVVATAGEALTMARKWRLWDWKSWVFGNIRYAYFTGTGTVYISGHGKVSINNDNVNTRIKEQHIVGFDTRSPIKMLRTETFANYWLNHKPLYDVHFPEQGRYVQQQSYGLRDDKVFRSLLEDVLGAMGKLMGF